MKTQKAEEVVRAIKRKADSDRSVILQRFFKTGKGDYAEGDVFLGLTVPESRNIAKDFRSISLTEVHKLLRSKIHEVRLVALVILVMQYTKSDQINRKKIFNLYLSQTDHINNWDLVDLSAPHIIGTHVLKGDRKVLYTLALSSNIWERRIAVVATYALIRSGEYADTLAIAKLLIEDKHDLIHKAVGWMLREVGKRDVKMLTAFLDDNCLDLPRTTLRYAIERFPHHKRLKYLRKV